MNAITNTNASAPQHKPPATQDARLPLLRIASFEVDVEHNPDGQNERDHVAEKTDDRNAENHRLDARVIHNRRADEQPTTISAIVSLFTMLASRWIGSCEPTISILTRNWPRVSMRDATFSSLGGKADCAAPDGFREPAISSRPWRNPSSTCSTRCGRR